MRSGVAGIGTSVTPSEARASRIAFITVGVEARVPPSPTPLAPNGLVELDRAGLRVDFELADMAAIGEARPIRGKGAGALQAHAELRRQSYRDERHLRDLSYRHRAVGAGDREGAIGKTDVGGVRLHEM